MYVAVANLQCFVPPKAATKNTGRNIKCLAKDSNRSKQSTTYDRKRKRKQPYFNNDETKGRIRREGKTETKEEKMNIRRFQKGREGWKKKDTRSASAAATVSVTILTTTARRRKRSGIHYHHHRKELVLSLRQNYGVHNNNRKCILHS